MHRYYMTAQTRQALIAESNRLIAVRAELQAARARRERDRADPRDEDNSSLPSPDSVFARLVADLRSTARRASAVAVPS
jgi:hypothetical protein